MTKYRILKKGELIQKGDEADASRTMHDDAKWVPVAEHSIGKPASDPKYPAHTIYRRPVKLIALYDRDPIELTQRFVDALEEVMLAEMEMMRNREPELADCWTWGRCGVQDLAMGQVDFEFGGDEDRPESLPDGEFVIVEIEDESEIAGIINGLTN